MIKSCKASLLGFVFLFCGGAAGTATANEVFTAHMNGEDMLLVSKLAIFDPEVPGQVIDFADYLSDIPTGATGKLVLRITKDSEIHYQLDVAHQNLWLNLEGIPGPVGVIHIHLGKKGSYGPVMFELFHLTRNGPYPENGEYSGVLTADDLFTQPFTYGPIRPATLVEYGIRNMADAMKAIREGNAHVNVHTAKHWAGEIAGNIKPVKHRFKRNHRH